MSNPTPTWTKAAAAIVVLAAASGGIYYFNRPTPPPPPVFAPPPAAQPVPPPAEKYPVPEAPVPATAPPPAPLPELYDSDVAALTELLTLFGDGAVATLIRPEFLIPRIVATVDNLPRQKLNSHALAVKPVPGAFVVDVQGSDVFIADANSRRYEAYVAAFAEADSAQLLALYQRWYPLFQQAYRELGDPNAHFNDRLVEVIDHMLQAPDVTPPLALVKPASNWEYADPALQGASIGHRLLFRLGPAHAARVKAKLVELRARLTGFDANTAAAG
jgi:hypothetical protein